jgi:hypothetical protein
MGMALGTDAPDLLRAVKLSRSCWLLGKDALMDTRHINMKQDCAESAGRVSRVTELPWPGQEEADRLVDILVRFPTSEQEDAELLHSGTVEHWAARMILKFRILRKQVCSAYPKQACRQPPLPHFS